MEKNKDLNISYVSCFFIRNASELLRLSYTTFCTSIFIFHKFYRKKNSIKYNHLDAAISCILLASKLEEQSCNLKRIICVYNFLKSEYFETKYQNLTVLDASKIKERIILIEMNILKYFGFNPIIINPLKILHCFFINHKDICIEFVKKSEVTFIHTSDENTDQTSFSDSNYKTKESQIHISDKNKLNDMIIPSCKDKSNNISNIGPGNDTINDILISNCINKSDNSCSIVLDSFSKHYRDFISRVTKKLNDLIFCPSIINLDIHLICYIAINLSFNLDKNIVMLYSKIEEELNWMYKLYKRDFKEKNFFKNIKEISSDNTSIKKSIDDFLIRENVKKRKK